MASSEAEFGESPNHPLGGIDLPWLHVGVFIVSDMFMVSAVLAGPEEHGVFKGAGTEDQGQQPNDPVRLKRLM